MSVFKAAVKIIGSVYDDAAKLKRAKDQDFGEETFYHATTADIKEFDNSKIGTVTDDGWFGRGHYFSPSSKYSEEFIPDGLAHEEYLDLVSSRMTERTFAKGGNVIPVKLRAQKQYDWRANEIESEGRGMANANAEMRQNKTDELINAGYSGVDVFDDKVMLGEDETLSPEQFKLLQDYYAKNHSKTGLPPAWLKKETVEKTLRVGANKDAYVKTYGEDFVSKMPIKRILKERMVFDPKNIRSVNAKFDQSKTDSSNLLSSILTGGVGLSVLNSEKAEQ
mgnify:CR=1 FL=1